MKDTQKELLIVKINNNEFKVDFRIIEKEDSS